MTSTLAAIADAVVRELNETEFSRRFHAERLYDPERELETLEELRVDVILGDAKTEAGGRAGRIASYRIEVAVHEKLDTDQTERLDALVGLVEEIDRHFATQRRLAHYPSATWQSPSEVVYPYFVPHLAQRRQFTSLLRLTYKVVLP